MKLRAKHFYEFGPSRIDAEQELLTRDGEVAPLTPKVLETLVWLVERRGQIVRPSKGCRRPMTRGKKV